MKVKDINRGRLNAAEHREHSCQTVSERPPCPNTNTADRDVCIFFIPTTEEQIVFLDQKKLVLEP